ncbi:MAG: alpha-amylase [Bacteroidia bacterium]|nr:alpha-amylase [Bacteroidia bacterium]
MMTCVCAVLCFLFTSCDLKQEQRKPDVPIDHVPEWSKTAIWYQIFVERFSNGDTGNDPTRNDIAGSYPGYYPDSWAITPWTQDWYKPDRYFDELEDTVDWYGGKIERFEQKLQLRRYGGDLQGVLNKIDYLDSLGITAVYFNPLNDAPSLHKYDPRHWRHIDRNFGPSPKEDVALMATEVPDNPGTWKMTGADEMFVEVIKALHDKGIKVIMDYSWNHTGLGFWAVEDIRKQGAASRYVNWYWVKRFDDPNTLADELEMKGWFGVKDLPEIKETVLHEGGKIQAYEGNLYDSMVKQHIFHVSRRWLDPNGDGNPEDGVDGFRLDVAAEIGLGFWREYRHMVRGINPDAYLVGEVWWEEWPDHLLDPEPFLKGDVFDAVMNYRWYRAARHLFAAAPDTLNVSAFVEELNRLNSNLRVDNTQAMMNVMSSHDAPRALTSLFNKNKYKYNSKPLPGNSYKINKPDEETYQTLRLLLAHQFTYVGAPHIWGGDEMGMWGADDPDNRKPLIWPDMTFEQESVHPLGEARPIDEVKFNEDLFNYYRKLIQIRRDHTELAHGNIEFSIVDDARKLFGYRRFFNDHEVIAVFNLSNSVQQLSLAVSSESNYMNLITGTLGRPLDGFLVVELKPRSAMLLAPQEEDATQ